MTQRQFESFPIFDGTGKAVITTTWRNGDESVGGQAAVSIPELADILVVFNVQHHDQEAMKAAIEAEALKQIPGPAKAPAKNDDLSDRVEGLANSLFRAHWNIAALTARIDALERGRE